MLWSGVDLGGTNIKVGLVSEEGTLLKSTTEKTRVDDGYETILEQINGMVRSLAASHSISMTSIAGIGAGVPGTTSPEGVVYFANNLHWEERPFQQDLEHLLKRPVFVENDASMAAMGELCCGSLKGVTNGILITLGTGLGTGLVIHGDVYSGSHGLGRQAGHIKVGKNFYDCTCGGNGCLETFSSATALVRYYVHRRDHDNHANSEETLHQPTAREIMKAAAAGDPLAVEAFERLVHYLGIGTANLINTLDPEVIALGGGLSKAGNQLLEPLQQSIVQQLYDKKRFYTQIVLATLGNEAGMVGGAMYARRKLN
jgi:glucokinase